MYFCLFSFSLKQKQNNTQEKEECGIAHRLFMISFFKLWKFNGECQYSKLSISFIFMIRRFRNENACLWKRFVCRTVECKTSTCCSYYTIFDSCMCTMFELVCGFQVAGVVVGGDMLL